MKYELKVQPNFFDYIVNGTKRIEIRLFKEVVRDIKIDDVITIFKEPNLDEAINVKVVDLLKYNSFYDLFNDFDMDILADKSRSKKELMNELNRFYSKEMQEKYGVMGIRFELI